MALTHIITHRIQRQDPLKEATVALRENCLSKNGRVEECFRELKHGVIKRLGKEYGRFSDDSANHPVSNWLREYTQDKLSFESFTQKAMSQLKDALDKTEEVLEGFLFFAHETQEAVEYMHIFMVQHNTGQFVDGELEMSESFHLDTGGVTLSAKVNITDWQSGDEHRSSNALTLLRWRGEKELSDAFADFIGFAEKVDLGAETEAFLGLVADYTKDLPEAAAHQTKKQVVNYCLEQDKIGKPVVMSELSSELKDNPAPKKSSNKDDDNEGDQEGDTHLQIDLPEFASFVEQQQPARKPELIPDISQLRQFVRLSGRNNQMSRSFASSCLGDTIVYDPESDSLTIKDIPPKLKARLAKLLQEGGGL
jgi:nucleoid-associated protein